MKSTKTHIIYYDTDKYHLYQNIIDENTNEWVFLNEEGTVDVTFFSKDFDRTNVFNSIHDVFDLWQFDEF